MIFKNFGKKIFNEETKIMKFKIIFEILKNLIFNIVIKKNF